MFDIYTQEIEWGGRTLKLETGRIARQANGAVLATYGQTSVLCTAVGEKNVRPGMDFFPLTVNYQEKTFAAGKIPGGFFKREGRPSEKETLVCRLIDRPIRPLFAKGFRNETQVICTVVSHDLETDPDLVAMVGASAALTISGLPFMGPIGGAKIGYKDGDYILNPTLEQLEESELELFVAGTRDGVLMVESEAKELSEEVMLGAVNFGHEQMQPVINAIIDLAERCAKEPWQLPEPDDSAETVKEKLLSGGIMDSLATAYQEADKQERQKKVSAVKEAAVANFGDEEEAASAAVFLLSPRSSGINAQTMVVDAGMSINYFDNDLIRRALGGRPD